VAGRIFKLSGQPDTFFASGAGTALYRHQNYTIM